MDDGSVGDGGGDHGAGKVAKRVGDAERRLVDERLQQAVGDGLLTLAEYDERAGQVWQARTQADLALVVRDLPDPVAAPEPISTNERAPVTGEHPRPRRVFAVLSGDQWSAPVRPGQGVEAYAVLGQAVLDLRREDLPAQVSVNAVAVLGAVEVLVPRGTTVHLSGLSLMGARELRLDPPRAGAPVVDLRGYAVLGSVEVSHGAADRPVPGVDLRKSDRVGTQVTRTPGHSVRRSGRGRRRHGLLIGVAGLALAGLVGFQVTGQDASTVFGSTSYQVPADRASVDVGMLFGSAEVIIPAGKRAEVTGPVVFGSRECPTACSPDAGTRTVKVHVTGAFGSVKVLTKDEASSDAINQ